MNTENQEYLTIQEAAQILRMNIQGVRRLMKLGLLKAYKPSSRKTYFIKENIDEYARRSVLN